MTENERSLTFCTKDYGPANDGDIMHPRPTIEFPPHGFVSLVSSMGGDAAIIRAARTSYGKGTKTLRDDVKLLKYMFDHGHTSVFEQTVMVFHMKLPIFLARQFIRHRTARLNELSGRYSEMPDEIYMLPAETGEKGIKLVPAQHARNRQASSAEDKVSVNPILFQRWENNARDAFRIYQELLAAGVSKELARIHLPLSTYTNWYWQMDLHNLIGFLQKRMGSGAQGLAQEYARGMVEIARLVAPETIGIAFPDLEAKQWQSQT